ncbi:MAG: DNA polymerase I [Moraxellaceae bacterium]|nr:DNA polymerase I [Moraxellaceae bacterium]
MSPKPLVLVDGSFYIYRSFFALPPLSTKDGQPTGAIKGALNALNKLLKQYQPSHVAVIFDAGGATFRHELSADYKAHRPPTPDDLKAQFAPLQDIVRAMGLPVLLEQGVEGDDILGTLAVEAASHGWDVIISTGDKDMAQLVNDRITLVNPFMDTVLDATGVEAKFGVKPSQIIDYLALVGDASDGIAGVQGVGPKTAVKWLQEHGSIANLIANAASIKGKVGETFRNSLSQVALSQQLATIDCQLALKVHPDALIRQAPNHTVLKDLYQRFEFNALLASLDASALPTLDEQSEPEAPPISTKYHTVNTVSAWSALLDKLNLAPAFAFDTETTSLNYKEARIVGFSVSLVVGEAYYVPLAHSYLGAPEQLDRDTVLKQLKAILENPHIGKIGQHLKYDTHVLANHGISVQGIVFDTMLASYVLDAIATRHNLDDLAKHYLNYQTTTFEELAGKGVKQLTFDQIEVEKASHYACEDADITLRLKELFVPKLLAEPSLNRLLHDIEMPVAPILQQMEARGTLLDFAQLQKLSQQMGERLTELEKQAHDIAGTVFNLASPKQLGEILFDKLGLEGGKKTATGQYATGENILEQLEHPLAKVILEHRSLSKLKGTYTDTLPKMANPVSKRIHTSYHQAVTATGRLSSSDPNLQNIPIRSAEGRQIRQAFIAADGYQLVAADYSQIELRLMAHLSQDERLLHAFSMGEDIHKATAAEVFGIPLNEVSNEQRRNAKAINFGLLYGMSAFGLAKQINASRSEAQAYIDLYFNRYTGVKRYMDNIRHQAGDKGFVETLFGRKLPMRDIHSKNPSIRQAAERAAINAPLQGSAADIIKLAMIAVDAQLKLQQLDAYLLLQVHDELVLEVKNEHVERVKAMLPIAMSGVANLAVPLLVEVGVGKNWDEAH